mmetsp:Transcript_3700/g.15364  ORF Transcript_3700/g.15364 Transcript_3700/m.15364 type:complete len:299 (+) Transcript_3700:4202-5098(+)
MRRPVCRSICLSDSRVTSPLIPPPSIARMESPRPWRPSPPASMSAMGLAEWRSRLCSPAACMPPAGPGDCGRGAVRADASLRASASGVAERRPAALAAATEAATEALVGDLMPDATGGESCPADIAASAAAPASSAAAASEWPSDRDLAWRPGRARPGTASLPASSDWSGDPSPRDAPLAALLESIGGQSPALPPRVRPGAPTPHRVRAPEWRASRSCASVTASSKPSSRSRTSARLGPEAVAFRARGAAGSASLPSASSSPEEAPDAGLGGGEEVCAAPSPGAAEAAGAAGGLLSPA